MHQPTINSCWENMHYEPLQQTHLQWRLLKMSPTAGDETSRGRNPENGRRRDFGWRRRHWQSGFQHTDRPWPSSPELFNKDHNAGCESLGHLQIHHHVKNIKHSILLSSEESIVTVLWILMIVFLVQWLACLTTIHKVLGLILAIL